MRHDLANATDAELLVAQDADAFAVVYDRHVRQVFGWARVRVGEHAADLTAASRFRPLPLERLPPP